MAKDKNGRQYVSKKQLIANNLYAAKQKVKLDRVEERQMVRSTLSPQEQLYVLDRRLGEGKGASKERIRLWKQIAAQEGTNVTLAG